MAWIENDQGSLLLVRQTAGQKLWTLPGGEVRRNEWEQPGHERKGSGL